MIELRSVSAGIGHFRLADITLTIGTGDCHVIVGPTGSGKTFLLETIIGLREPASGSIFVAGQNVAGLPPHQRLVSYVPQDTCLFPTMTVFKNIRFGLDVRGTPQDDDLAFLNRLINFLQVDKLLDRFPKNLSGGEKQRVALARALATKPALLILDEPFSAIDHSLREEIRRMIKDLLDEFKTTTLIVTHDLGEAFFLGDRISIMMGGRIIQSGPREEIYYYPRSLAAAGFLGIKNLFHGLVEDISPHEITLSSVDLERTFTVPCHCAHKRFSPGQPVRFGIRSEAVYVLRKKANIEEGQNVFNAFVRKVFVRGQMHTVIVELRSAAGTTVEIDIHDVAARKIGIAEGIELQINLNPRHIFLLEEST